MPGHPKAFGKLRLSGFIRDIRYIQARIINIIRLLGSIRVSYKGYSSSSFHLIYTCSNRTDPLHGQFSSNPPFFTFPSVVNKLVCPTGTTRSGPSREGSENSFPRLKGADTNNPSPSGFCHSPY